MTTDDIDTSPQPDAKRVRTARTGPIPKSDSELRKHAVGCRLTSAEIAKVDRLKGGVSRGEWLRLAALEKPPRIVPPVNLEAWSELSHTASNLNQLTKHLNEGRLPPDADLHRTLMQLKADLGAVRAGLIGLAGESSDEG